MSEMINMAPPWEGMTREEVTCAVAAGRRPSIMPGYCDSAPNGWKELMCKCWDQDPAERPDFEVVHTQLTQIQSNLDEEAASSQGASYQQLPSLTRGIADPELYQTNTLQSEFQMVTHAIRK